MTKGMGMEMGRRVAMEKELEASAEHISYATATYDESGNFLVCLCDRFESVRTAAPWMQVFI